MYKELFICIIIIITIISFDYILQVYTDNAIGEINACFNEINTTIRKGYFNSKEIEKKTDELYSKWRDYNSKFSYYIEHTELEKVETSFITYKSYLKSKQYYDSLAELEKTVFILNHINEKYSFNLPNIF